MKRPNILIVMADQLSGVLFPDGPADFLHVPHLRALAERATRYANCYTGSPLCAPGRASFMSGQLPRRTRVYDNAAEFCSDIPTYAHHLRRAGWHTCLSGKMHFVGPDQLHGFEERLTTDIYPADFGWTPDYRKPGERIDWWYHNMGSITGAGVAERDGVLDQIDIIECTLGKAVGVMGGYIAADAVIVDAVRSWASGFIFTTSLPPALTAGALASVRHLKAHPELRQQHQERAATLKARFAAAGIPVMESESHIVPVHVGDPVHCKMISDMLLDEYGVYVQPINYPTVPKGTERLRFTPSPNHTDAMMDHVVQAMDKLFAHCNVARRPVAA